MDTRNKRSSSIHMMLPWRGQYPAPDGAIGQADRQHIALMYAGISATQAGVTDGGVIVYDLAQHTVQSSDVIIHGLVPSDVLVNTLQPNDTVVHTIAPTDSAVHSIAVYDTDYA